jgi:hypothetical protein
MNKGGRWLKAIRNAWRAKALRRFIKLKGKRVQLVNGAFAFFTGGVGKAKAGRSSFLYVPEMRCAHLGHLFLPSAAILTKRRSVPRNCSGCVASVGGIKKWTRDVAQTVHFKILPDDYFQRRNNLKNKKGIVCCEICGQPENGKKLSIDHDQRHCYGREVCGKCNRGMICQICNFIIAAIEQEKMPYGVCLKHDNYIKEWHKKLNKRLYNVPPLKRDKRYQRILKIRSQKAIKQQTISLLNRLPLYKGEKQ